MTAFERYEKAWNQYLVLLNRDTSIRLTPFLREKNIHIRGMQQWMANKGLSVRVAKSRMRMCQAEAQKKTVPPYTASTGSMFLPIELSAASSSQESRDLLSGIFFTFPDGTQVSIKSGSAKAVMSFMKLYQREDVLCLE